MRPDRVWIDNLARQMNIRTAADTWIFAPLPHPIVSTWELPDVFLAVFKRDSPADPVLAAFDYTPACRWIRHTGELPLQTTDDSGDRFYVSSIEGVLRLNHGDWSCEIVDAIAPQFGPVTRR